MDGMSRALLAAAALVIALALVGAIVSYLRQ